MKLKTPLFAILTVLTPVFFPALAMAQDATGGDAGGFLDSLNAFFDAFPVWLAALTTLVSALAGIAALTETKKDDEIIEKVKTFLKGIAGFHKGNAEGLATKKRKL